MKELEPGFIWEANSELKFQNALCSSEVQVEITDFNKTPFTENVAGVDLALSQFSNFMTLAAAKSLKRPVGQRKKSSIINRKKWYTSDLKKLKSQVRRAGYLLTQYPRDPHIRGTYHATLKLYKKRCKAEVRKFRSKLLDTLDNLHESNPSEYWKLVKALSDDSNTIEHQVDANQFYQHYKDLNNDKPDLNNFQKEVQRKLISLKSLPSFSELDFAITDSEILKAIKQLKNNKAYGLDLLRNEMFKAGSTLLLSPLKKLFNLIFRSGHYPASWAEGRIISIHKKGDKNDPSNYRGITISSSLGKMFNSILNSRLCTFLDSNKIIRPEQIGFRKKTPCLRSYVYL